MEGGEDKPNLDRQKEIFFANPKLHFRAILVAKSKEKIEGSLSRFIFSLARGSSEGLTNIAYSELNKSFPFLSNRLSKEMSPETRKEILLEILTKCRMEEDPYLKALRKIK